MDYKSYAKKYYDIGLNISCLSYLKTKYNIDNIEKQPSHPWIDLQIRRQQETEIENLPWQFSTGLGCIISNDGIKCIDIDNCHDISVVETLLKLFSLPKDYEWVVKTPNGFHVYILSGSLFFSHKVLNNGILTLLPNDEYKNKFSRIELRWAGHCVLPPTKISTNKYSFLFEKEFPSEKPKYISTSLVFEFICNISGSTKYFPYDHNPKIIQTFKGELKIGNYFIKVGWGSEHPRAIELYENNELIFEQNEWNQTYSKKREHRYNYNLYLDVETTGLINDPTDYSSYPRIIQMSWLKEKYGELEEKEFYIKPKNFSLPNNIIELTGITDNLLNEKGIDIEQALRFLDFGYHGANIVCHNVDFDLSILDSEYFRIGERNLLRNSPTFCTMKTMAEIFNNKYPKLSELYEFLFKEPVSTRIHNSTEDVKILRDCYKIMDLYGYI